MSSKAEQGLAVFSKHVGQVEGTGEWFTVDQERVNLFADATLDHQFIHVDPERARRETPFGGTIAHGFLTLSLIPAHRPADLPSIAGLTFELNYGLDRVRFLAPVRVGARVRILTRVLSVEDKGPGRVLFKMEKTLEIEGEARPGYVAEQLGMFIVEAGRG